MAAGQPRDWRGRWTSGGGFTAGNSVQMKGFGKNRNMRITQLKNGKPVKPGRIAKANAAYRIGRVGSPLNGNKNVRYVSRTHAALRLASTAQPNLDLRGAGRYVSRRGATAATQPKTGYIIQYQPRK